MRVLCDFLNAPACSKLVSVYNGNTDHAPGVIDSSRTRLPLHPVVVRELGENRALRSKSCSFFIVRLLLAVSLCLPFRTLAETSLRQWIAFNRAGAPNSNLQCFTPRNVKVSDGNLIIITNSDTATCSSIDLSSSSYNYTSGFVSMQSFSFLYGTVEFRAKFGGGAGTGAWPAVWMADASCQASDPTGTDERCNQEEIDIAEILNGDFTQVNEQIHVDNFAHNDGCKASTSDTSQSFHIYQLIWSPGSLVFRIDGTTTCTITRKYVPKAAMYVKISMFVGKAGGRAKNDSLPWKTLIDYVKVTQGSAVVFNDDFSLASTIESGRATVNNASSSSGIAQKKTPGMWLYRSLPALVVCLILVGVAIALPRGDI
jgi:beta-glucanase (GH16 family)